MNLIINVTHIITGLGLGGAEKMLYKLLESMDKDEFNIEVITLKDKGFYGPKIEDLGIKVHVINMKKIPTIKNLLQIRSIIKNVDIVQTWMYHADLLGYLATRFRKKQKLLWGIRTTSLNKERNKTSTLFISKINSVLSKRVDKVISCSIAAKRTHIDYGYSEDNLIVIPNGFEMDKLYFDPKVRLKIREELSLENKKIIINIGRWNIAKDHKNLIEAYSRIEKENTHLIMIGPNITEENSELINIVKENKVRNYSLLGSKHNIYKYLSVADIYVSSSKTEGFPNVIGEAMACELPCIVTDAGDSSYIVDDIGLTVPIENSERLGEAIKEMINLSYQKRRELGKSSRKRIEENFNIEVIANMFEEQYREEELK